MEEFGSQKQFLPRTAKDIKQFDQELDRPSEIQASTYMHTRHYYNATFCSIKLLLIKLEVNH